jgi:hypothetical protein
VRVVLIRHSTLPSRKGRDHVRSYEIWLRTYFEDMSSRNSAAQPLNTAAAVANNALRMGNECVPFVSF